MMHIALDYSVRSTMPSFWRLGTIVIAATMLGWLGWEAYRLQTQLQGLEWRMLERQRAAAPKPVASPAQDRNESRIAEANRLLAELGVPWNRLFTSLEITSTPQVALLEIKPEAAKGRLRISGEARNMAVLLGYVRTLEALDTLRDVSILEHEVLATDIGQTVAFRLQAQWEMQP
jgi:hypothetical protein